ncbi:MAG TPA: hypothetical protein VE986_05680 [Hyphomicrobiales bacterium]|nr:hypothetical protein [Hyphomicrobiales bacterium]
MSSGSRRDPYDFWDDGLRDDDYRRGYSDTWSGFWGGILLGIAGGALIPLGPWLGGLLMLAGYGMAASTLRSRRSRFAGALRFGFFISAIIGAALILGHGTAPAATWSIISYIGDRHLIFPGVAAIPWMLAILRYFYRLFRPPRR